MTHATDSLIAKLVHQLQDKDPVTRLNAAGALRLHGPRASSAISELRLRLEDEDVRVRAEAQKALDRLRQAAA